MTPEDKRKAEVALRDAIIEAAANVSAIDLRPPRLDRDAPRAFVEAGGAVYVLEVRMTREPGWRKRPRRG